VSYLYLNSDTSVATGTTGLYVGLNAKGVSIRWNQNAAVSNTANSTSPTSSTSSASNGCSSSSSSGSCHKGVSAGAIAGAVVGSVIGLGLLVTAVWTILAARGRLAHQSYEVEEKRAKSMGQNHPREVAGGELLEIGPGKGDQANPPSYAQELP
jgi:uncharacterized membrane protein YebE (DUF533 family)